MSQITEAAPTEAETDEVLASFTLWNARNADYARDLAAAKNSFEAYWASSVSQQVTNDMRSGRFVNVSLRAVAS